MSKFAPSSTDATSIATIRTLAADVVGKANSGHPGQPSFPKLRVTCRNISGPLGAPMGMAPVTHVLFTRSVYVIVPSLFTSLDPLEPAFSTPIQGVQSGSTVTVSCFLMGMFLSVSSSGRKS